LRDDRKRRTTKEELPVESLYDDVTGLPK